MTRNNAVSPAPERRRRWPIVLVTVAIATVVVVAATGLIVWWQRDPDAGARRAWQPPTQTFLAASMRVQPVPGWRTSVTDLGLPPSAPGVPAHSRIATDDDPFHSFPFVGNLGDDAYFIAKSAGPPDPQWWLVGIDVRDGRRLFPPVRLSAEMPRPECFLNGPDAVLCLRGTVNDVTAWVIDAHTGHVTYTGPSSLRTYPAKLTVHQIGIYAVATTENQGVYGIGSHAETTWFVPGSGHVDQMYPPQRDTAPRTLATQAAAGRGVDRTVVFSLNDGTVIKPKLADDAEQQMTVLYPGGFAAEIRVGQELSRVEFFDDTGTRTSQKSIKGSFFNLIDQPDLPVISFMNDWAVYSVDGDRLLRLSGDGPGEPRLIGTKFFFAESEGIAGSHWRQYDLQTGAEGKSCAYNLSYYIGTDGTVAVVEMGNPNVGRLTEAYDLATCDTLWTVRSAIGSFRQVWRINTTLVQLSDDGTELVSLVAPG